MIAKLVIGVCLTVLLFSCKENNKKTEPASLKTVEIDSSKLNKYPESFIKVLDAHGGLKAWKSASFLSFEILKNKKVEKHFIDLKNRKDKIETLDYSIGFDGANYWKLDKKNQFKGSPLFYHNLYFYFYAMPFVLADDGIVYAETEDLEFKGKSYPGIKINFNPGVGTSSKDNYFIHYDPETYKMVWLGYTVTFRTGEVSDKVKWIQYKNWETTNNLLLPKSIVWYAFDGKKILEPRKELFFENVLLENKPADQTFFNKPSGAQLVNKKEKP